MENINQSTTIEEQKIATSSIPQIKESSEMIISSGKPGVKITIENVEKAITIPRKALSLLFDIISTMSEGKSMTLIASDSELSTQEAADLLNVSRPHLVKMLKDGQIPYRKVGSHRRIWLNDIINYKHVLRKQREEQLLFLARQAQELSLGYE